MPFQCEQCGRQFEQRDALLPPVCVHCGAPLAPAPETDTFDPYYEWLGIPEREQPPDHYRLLGIQLFEPNARVIENAADRQMTHLRAQATGARGGEAQRLLNEVSAARRALLVPEKRTAYDRQLQQQLAPPHSAPRETGADPLHAVAVPAVESPAVAKKPRPRQVRRRPSRWLPVSIAGGGVVGTLLGYFLLFPLIEQRHHRPARLATSPRALRPRTLHARPSMTPQRTAPSDTTQHRVDGAPKRGTADTPTPSGETPDVPSDTAPSNTAPNGTAPNDTAPSDTAPSDTAPNDAAPNGVTVGVVANGGQATRATGPDGRPTTTSPRKSAPRPGAPGGPANGQAARAARNAPEPPPTPRVAANETFQIFTTLREMQLGDQGYLVLTYAPDSGEWKPRKMVVHRVESPSRMVIISRGEWLYLDGIPTEQFALGTQYDLSTFPLMRVGRRDWQFDANTRRSIPWFVPADDNGPELEELVYDAMTPLARFEKEAQVWTDVNDRSMQGVYVNRTEKGVVLRVHEEDEFVERTLPISAFAEEDRARILAEEIVHPVRRWENEATGTTVEASFIDFADNRLTVRRRDGTKVTIPNADLSGRDRDHLRDYLRYLKEDPAELAHKRLQKKFLQERSAAEREARLQRIRARAQASREAVLGTIQARKAAAARAMQRGASNVSDP